MSIRSLIAAAVIYAQRIAWGVAAWNGERHAVHRSLLC
jgi:hypothetical protein